MLSFRVQDEEGAELERWSTHLGVERSVLLRRALHALLVRLASEDDIASWERSPLRMRRACGVIADAMGC